MILPAAPPRALPKVELIISTLPEQLRCSSVPLNIFSTNIISYIHTNIPSCSTH